ncbi:hypothetical protein OF83DRAFT_704415 [Amylostereum chailletii]|nr:hypothetical protein OF83DRAFT_704415 [Amylostereum chailletii]
MDTNNRFIARAPECCPASERNLMANIGGHSDQPSREGPLRLAIQSRSKQSPGDQHEEPPSRQPSQPPSLSKQASETISGEASQTNVLLRLRRKPLQSVPEPQTSRMKVSKISLRLSDATQLSSDTKLRVHLVSRQKKELYRTEYLAGIDGSWRTWQANADIPYAFFKAQVYERGALFNYFIAEALVDPFDLSRNDGDVLCEYIPNLKVLNPRWTSMQIKFSFSDLPPKPLPASFIPAGDKVETTSQSSLDSTRRDVDHANEAIQNIHSEALANSLEYLDTVISVLEGVSFITEVCVYDVLKL